MGCSTQGDGRVVLQHIGDPMLLEVTGNLLRSKRAVRFFLSSID